MITQKFYQTILSLPKSKAQKAVYAANVLVGTIFFVMMCSTATAAWFLFTSSHKIPCFLILALLGVTSFHGGRLHRIVHDAKYLFSTE